MQSQKIGSVSLATPNKSEPGIALDLTPLHKILKDEDVKNLPVVIVSVNGNTRLGKSFFLNQAVKYLTFGNLSNPNDHSWIDQDLNECFQWSSKISSVTRGISIWPAPFIRTDSKGNKFCVILMDNQGLFGTQNGCNEEYKLYALSNLISSLFIYFNRDEGRHCLESLNEFCEFSKAFEHNGSTEDSYKFGHLLIRLTDFAWDDYPLENGCCFYDEQNTAKRETTQDLYELNFRLDKDLNERFKKKRQQLLDSFETITIATTSPFGETKPNTLKPPTVSDKQLGNKWGAGFLAGTIKFVETVFSSKMLENSKKTLRNKETVTGAQLVKIIQRWEIQLNDPKYNVKDCTKFGGTVEGYFAELKAESERIFAEKFNEYRDRMAEEYLQTFYEKTRKQIYEEFWQDCLYQNHRIEHWLPFEASMREKLGRKWESIKAKRHENRYGAKVAAAVSAAAGGALTVAGAVVAIGKGTMVAGAAVMLGAGGVLVATPVVVFGVWKVWEKWDSKFVEQNLNKKVGKQKLQ